MHAIFSANFLTLRAGQSLVSWFLVSPNTILRKDNLILQWISLSNTTLLSMVFFACGVHKLNYINDGGRVFLGVGHANLSDFVKTTFCEYWTSIKIKISTSWCTKSMKLKQTWYRSTDYAAKNEVFIGLKHENCCLGVKGELTSDGGIKIWLERVYWRKTFQVGGGGGGGIWANFWWVEGTENPERSTKNAHSKTFGTRYIIMKLIIFWSFGKILSFKKSYRHIPLEWKFPKR